MLGVIFIGILIVIVAPALIGAATMFVIGWFILDFIKLFAKSAKTAFVDPIESWEE
jgi:hypothetical protein